MRNLNVIKVGTALILLSFFFLGNVEGQCSMCRAVVENNDANIGEGLNNGIVYLMAIPYALLISVGIVLFRKQFQDKQLFPKAG